MTYIDLFAGCGGLSWGLYKAGWEGLFAVEKSKDAFATLKHNLIDNNNHFDWPQWLDKNNIDINDLLNRHQQDLSQLQGQVDLVVGGPPCQGFSMAGQRLEADTRNVLCHSYIEFLRLVRPRALFFENVLGFTIAFNKRENKDAVPYSEIVLDALKELGYNVHGKLIDVSEYGVPQKRKRYIIVGMLEGSPREFFSRLSANREQFCVDNHLTQRVNMKQAIGDLHRSNGTFACPESKRFDVGLYGKASSRYQKFVRQGLKEYTHPDSHRFANQRPETVELLESLMSVYNKAKRITPKQSVVKGLKKRSIVPLKATSICATITSIPDDFIHYAEPRIMTVREMARIQSFPDCFQFKGKYTTGGKLRRVEVPRYTQVANAVPPLFAEQVGLTLIDML